MLTAFVPTLEFENSTAMARSNDSNEDPQQTMRPREREASRRLGGPRADAESGGTRGRRLKFGNLVGPTDAPSQHNADEADPLVHRGFNLGGHEVKAEPANTASQRTVQPWILFVAGGAVLLLLAALLFRPSSPGNAEAAANERLVTQYTQYLEGRQKNKLEVSERKKEVLERLQAIAWAKAVGDRNALEIELRGLLFIDNDKNSPLYQYSVGQLKQLPTRKSSGL